MPHLSKTKKEAVGYAFPSLHLLESVAVVMVVVVAVVSYSARGRKRKNEHVNRYPP